MRTIAAAGPPVSHQTVTPARRGRLRRWLQSARRELAARRAGIVFAQPTLIPTRRRPTCPMTACTQPRAAN
jgi:hypothetical protein